ncbi:hypothetical protein ACFYYH_09000 [Streptomyces sp. NPDC002018]|uniref:hypothetical protein n=1 Tax=Streptomyces sp. NPDC002018 TaxID=3364629 RepID=UPI003684C481
MRRPHRLATLSTAFSAFCDLHRPGYLAYAEARLPTAEAEIAVTHVLGLIATEWAATMRRPSPAAYAWERLTAFVAMRAGEHPSRTEDAGFMYDNLDFTIDKIATLTGTDPGKVTAMIAARHPTTARTKHATHRS